MGYLYATERAEVFLEENQNTFLRIRDSARRLLDAAGAFQMGKVIGVGSSWTNMACVDRLVELGELREVPQENVAGQHRIFIKA